MDANVYAFLNANRSELLYNTAMQRFSGLHQTMSMPPIPYRVPPPRAPSHHLPVDNRYNQIASPHSEPLDLTKSAVSTKSHNDEVYSKLERMLSSNSPTTRSRKRPYSSLSTQKEQFRPTIEPPTTSTPSVVGMHEAPDNPVIVVELSADSATATSENFSCVLIRMMSKVFTISQFTHFSEQEKVALLHNSWHRLMLWSLANDSFTFTVSPLKSQPTATFSIAPSYKRQPTMAFVRGISVFMKKFASLHISAEEFSLLFGITLFHAGKPSQSRQSIDERRKNLMRQLQTLVCSTNSDPKRYTDLLLCLPLLYSVDESMFENLFCGKDFGNGDIKLLLKDAVRQVTRKTCSG